MANSLVNQIRDVLGQLYPNDAISIKNHRYLSAIRQYGDK